MSWYSLASRCKDLILGEERIEWGGTLIRVCIVDIMSFCWLSRRVLGRSFPYRPRPHACLARNTVWRGALWRTTFRFLKVRARACCGWLSRLSSSAGQRCLCAAACHWCGLSSWCQTVIENPYSWFPLQRGTPTAQWRYGDFPLTENRHRCWLSQPRRVSGSPLSCSVVHIPCLPIDCRHHYVRVSTSKSSPTAMTLKWARTNCKPCEWASFRNSLIHSWLIAFCRLYIDSECLLRGIFSNLCKIRHYCSLRHILTLSFRRIRPHFIYIFVIVYVIES